MPIVNMSVDVLLQAVNRGAPAPLAVNDLRQAITNIGTEVEELATMKLFTCGLCGRIIERTDQQGPPVDCPQCHADYRNNPAGFSSAGEDRVVRLNMLAARPDVFDPGGMARCLRGYLNIETGLREYPLKPATYAVKVDPRLAEESSYRPFISCAVLRHVALTDEFVKILMNMQENLHWALGRDRKLASIGAYDLDTLEGTTFRYDAVTPDELRFVPLGFDPASADANLTPAEILERHGTGRKYARLLAGFARYPLLRDEKGTVLSMPPIINSETTRVTQRSRNLFVDVTGPSQRVVDRALNVMVTGLRELLPELEIEQVRIEYQNAARLTPALTPSEMRLDAREAAETIGVKLDGRQVADLLERMGHRVGRASESGAETLIVHSPAWRNDIIHPIDLIEDAAVAYGYDNLPAELVPTFTVGQAREIEEQSALARRAFVGLGFHQVMTLGLTHEAAAFEKLRLPVDPRVVRIENPISAEQTICRVTLLPGLLETFAINKQHDLPQKLFEVGDVCRVDADAETGAREHRHVAAALIGTNVGYADIRAVCEAFFREFARQVQIKPIDSPLFIPGRGAALFAADGAEIGQMGEVHPEVLANYGLRHPAAVLELDFGRLVGAAGNVAAL